MIVCDLFDRLQNRKLEIHMEDHRENQTRKKAVRIEGISKSLKGLNSFKVTLKVIYHTGYYIEFLRSLSDVIFVILQLKIC